LAIQFLLTTKDMGLLKRFLDALDEYIGAKETRKKDRYRSKNKLRTITKKKVRLKKIESKLDKNYDKVYGKKK
jgi:hypothetical protein